MRNPATDPQVGPVAGLPRRLVTPHMQGVRGGGYVATAASTSKANNKVPESLYAPRSKYR